MNKKLIAFFLLLHGLAAIAQNGNNYSWVDSLYQKAYEAKTAKEFIKQMNAAFDASFRMQNAEAISRTHDSILSRLNNTTVDSDKVDLLYSFAEASEDTAHYFKQMAEGMALAKRINYSSGLANGLNTLGKALMGQGVSYYDRAIALYDSAFKVATAAGDKNNMAASCHFLGEIYRIKSDYSKALEFYNKGNEIAHESGDSTQLMLNYHDLGWMRINVEDDTSAMSYLRNGLAYAEGTRDSFWIADIILHMGEAKWKSGNFDESIKYSSKALKLFEMRYDTFHIADSYGQMGWVRESQQRFAEAEEYYRKAASFTNNDSLNRAPLVSGIGDALRGQKKYKEALRFYLEAEELFRNSPPNQWTRDNKQGLAETYAALGDIRKAYEYFKLFKLASDSVAKLQSTDKLAQTQATYDFQKRQQEMKLEQKKRDDEIKRQKLVRNGFMSGFGVVLLFAGVFLTQRNKIKKGKKRSDELLLNILPEEVAEELKLKGSADAKQFDDVTVMFTDFKNFTLISEKLTPTDLVNEIHTCFKAFDEIIAKHNIEKIKTIGDAYMCAGGLPVANKTNAADVVNAALEIQLFMQQHLQQRKREGKEVFEIRIGIHSGPVVAGIVGVKKFAYDIWGDTVNIAARMEQNSEAGKINISGATYELVKEKIKCAYRGKIQAKNKGEIDMYFVDTA